MDTVVRVLKIDATTDFCQQLGAGGGGGEEVWVAPTALTTSPLPIIPAPQPASKPFSAPTFAPVPAELTMFQYSSVGETVLHPAGIGVWVPSEILAYQDTSSLTLSLLSIQLQNCDLVIFDYLCKSSSAALRKFTVCVTGLAIRMRTSNVSCYKGNNLIQGWIMRPDYKRKKDLQESQNAYHQLTYKQALLGEVIPKCRLQRFMLSSSHDLCLTISSYVSVHSSRYEAHRKFGEHKRCIRVAQGIAESNSSFLSALQTSQVLHISMNAQLIAMTGKQADKKPG
ncbi:hypothetical protein pdam_00015641 [Pocillopora damicornis]|uniref:Uncharacterized protein n=1 Tax=Pocillopora damicornis TaxID=46731 RepID=A0A3M6UQJ1_POCDA|nr:hypothetical protein pdam_00015641 [Pocillopora damicornis]